MLVSELKFQNLLKRMFWQRQRFSFNLLFYSSSLVLAVLAQAAFSFSLLTSSSIFSNFLFISCMPSSCVFSCLCHLFSLQKQSAFITNFSCTFLSNLSASLPLRIILRISTLNLEQISPSISLYISSMNSWMMFFRCCTLAHQFSWLSKLCLMDWTLGERLKVPQLPPLATVRGSSSLEISLKTCRMSPNMPFSLVAPISSRGSMVSPPKMSHIQQVNWSMIWFMLNFSQRASYSLRRRSMNCPTEMGESKSKYFFRNMIVSQWPLPSSSSKRPLRTTDESSLREDERLRTRLRDCRSVDLSLAILLMAFSRGSLRGEVVTRSSMRDGVRVFLDGVRFPRGAGRGTFGFCCFCLGVSCC